MRRAACSARGLPTADNSPMNGPIEPAYCRFGNLMTAVSELGAAVGRDQMIVRAETKDSPRSVVRREEYQRRVIGKILPNLVHDTTDRPIDFVQCVAKRPTQRSAHEPIAAPLLKGAAAYEKENSQQERKQTRAME